MCPSSGLWGGVLDCDSQFTILSPPSVDGAQLWRSTSVCSSLYLITRAHFAQSSPSIPLWLASYLLAPTGGRIDWCCFHYFVRNSLVALLEALCARIVFFSFVNIWISFFPWHFFVFVCKVSNKAFHVPLTTRLLCLVVAIPLVCWLYMCACVCVPLYVHVKMCR